MNRIPGREEVLGNRYRGLLPIPPGFGAQDATALQQPILCLSFLNCKMGFVAVPSLQGVVEIKLCVLYKRLETGTKVVLRQSNL